MTRAPRTSSRWVRLADRVARVVITVGGLGTIVAISAVFLFLFWVVKDLFRGADLGPTTATAGPSEVLEVGCDEFAQLAWSLSADGVVRVLSMDPEVGGRLDSVPLPSESRITAWGRVPGSPTVVVGYGDGTVRVVRVDFDTDYIELADIEPEFRDLSSGGVRRRDIGVVERLAVGQFRYRSARVDVEQSYSVPGGAIVSAHALATAGGLSVAVVDRAGNVTLRELREVENVVTGLLSRQWSAPRGLDGWRQRSGRVDPPDFVRLLNAGENVVLAWRDGHAVRLETRGGEPEVRNLAPTGHRLTCVEVLLGGRTLLVAASDGTVRGWFTTRDDEGRLRLVQAHRLVLSVPEPATCVRASTRDRLVFVGGSSGLVDVFHATSEKHVASYRVSDRAVTAIAAAPKNDAVVAASAEASGARVHVTGFDARHPEITLGSVFGRTWYEQRAEPEFEWQSSGGSDRYEPKLSLVPLIFGTFKATFYSMLIGLPLALLAALYTSEFLTRRWRSRVKTVVELMASLPSVVLGFLAAVVIAPAIESSVVAVLTCALMVPLSLLFGATCWQLMPSHVTETRESLRLLALAVAIVVGVLSGVALAPVVETLLFSGDFRLWLDGSRGTSYGGWVLLLMPLCIVITGLVVRGRPRMAVRTLVRSSGFEVRPFVEFVVLVAVVLGSAALLAWPMSAWEIRNQPGSPLGTFDPRNALVVGVVMGFAIVPIIYSIAEDALSSVSRSLRAASLGTGATRWQTARRVVVPMAGSGLFAAAMVGLGRAVGETMIVFMAAGNTAVIDMNVFNGFKTLSANIVEELPEAVPDSTHYRMLFCSALVLLALTFVINTAAEAVRVRVRRRAHQL